MNKQLNITPVVQFFKEEIEPKVFAELLDSILYNYMGLLIRSSKQDNAIIPEDTDKLVYYIKYFRDVLADCKSNSSD